MPKVQSGFRRHRHADSRKLPMADMQNYSGETKYCSGCRTSLAGVVTYSRPFPLIQLRDWGGSYGSSRSSNVIDLGAANRKCMAYSTFY